MFSSRLYSSNSDYLLHTNYDYYISPAVDTILPPLKKIVQSLQQIQCGQQFWQGFTQFFQARHLWKAATQTKQVMLMSLTSNIAYYILPVIFYRRAMLTVTEKYLSETVAPLMNYIDYAIILTYFSWLYSRRLIDNISYSSSLTRAISEDVSKHLVQLGTEVFSESMMTIFEEVFTLTAARKKEVKNYLRNNIAPALKNFFNRSKFTPETFNKLVKPLENVFLDALNLYFYKEANEDYRKKFAELTAKIIKSVMKEEFKFSAAEQLADHTPGLQLLVGEAAAVKFIKNIQLNNQTIKPFLPIKYSTNCKCPLEKIIHANFSSQFYYTGNYLVTLIPALFLEVTKPETTIYYLLSGFYYFLSALAIINYGQSFNEYIIATEGTCTRHRYEAFAKNKFHSLGLGAAFYLSLQLLVIALQRISGVSSFFINDALANLLMQFGIISMLGFYRDLPGNDKNSVDLFLLQRWLVGKANGFLQSNANNESPKENMLEKIEDILLSDEFRYRIDFLLGNQYFPRLELFNWMDKSLYSRVNDPRLVLSNVPSIKLLVQTYKADILKLIERAESLHKLARWMPDFLFAFPVPGMVSILMVSLKYMKDDTWTNLIRNGELQRFLHFFDGCQSEECKVEINHLEVVEAGEQQLLLVSEDYIPQFPNEKNMPVEEIFTDADLVTDFNESKRETSSTIPIPIKNPFGHDTALDSELPEAIMQGISHSAPAVLTGGTGRFQLNLIECYTPENRSVNLQTNPNKPKPYSNTKERAATTLLNVGLWGANSGIKVAEDYFSLAKHGANENGIVKNARI